MSIAAHANPAPIRQLDALTGIRGLAAWFVVLFHIRQSLNALLPEWLITAFSKGYLAVDLFFMLSGFVLWYNYADRLRSGGRAEAIRFYWRRFSRIWPLHICILLAFIVFAGMLIIKGKDISAYPLSELPLHFLLIQNWGFTPILSWNDPAWSISTEQAAYVVFPMVITAYAWEKLASTTLVLLTAFILVTLYLVFAVAGLHSLGSNIAQMGLARCILEFALGNLLCLLWIKWRDVPRAAMRAWVACAACIIAKISFNLPETAIIPAIFASGLLALALDTGPIAKFFSTKSLIDLGEVSFSTYLSHYLLFIAFKIVFADDNIQLDGMGFGGFLALVFAASVLLYHLVEKPAQHWLNTHAPNAIGLKKKIAATA
jgi:peptidoglycan/LPS O-acetylase OafA/YrhL